MKPESEYFDKIRVRKGRRKAAGEAEKPKNRLCDAGGCREPAEFRAPKGRNSEGEYFWFCLDHVRAYNKGYNYFTGMDDTAVQDYQKDAAIGHRPTWRMGTGRGGESAPMTGRTKAGFARTAHDPFDLFEDRTAARAAPRRPQRKVHNMERRSLETLGLDERAGSDEIKARYKALVKRHHPDANGGDRSLEDRLRKIIQAYNYLKSAGFC